MIEQKQNKRKENKKNGTKENKIKAKNTKKNRKKLEHWWQYTTNCRMKHTHCQDGVNMLQCV